MATRLQLEADLRQAMRAGDEVRKRTLRQALSAVKLAEVDERRQIDEAQITAILQREVKSRRETIADAEQAGRPDLIQAAQAEMDVLHGYLPAELTQAELEELIRQVIASSGASGPGAMGQVMKEVMTRVEGRADGRRVSELARRLLS
jgi:uncharacterized protein